jgi:hypothetical protein
MRWIFFLNHYGAVVLSGLAPLVCNKVFNCEKLMVRPYGHVFNKICKKYDDKVLLY